jgi:hypothetical protein
VDKQLFMVIDAQDLQRLMVHSVGDDEGRFGDVMALVER